MKKIVLIVILCLGFVVVQGCRDTKQEATTEGVHEHDREEVVMNHEFACPMGCEEGKTYEEKISCPVCNMALMKVEDSKNHTEHKAHD